MGRRRFQCLEGATKVLEGGIEGVEKETGIDTAFLVDGTSCGVLFLVFFCVLSIVTATNKKAGNQEFSLLLHRMAAAMVAIGGRRFS